jgi:hypothetical protein
MGTAVYTTADGLDEVVACIFPEWSAEETKFCREWPGEHIAPTDSGTCHVCVTSAPVCGDSCAAQVRDGSWGLFRAKVKSWSHVMDFSCLHRSLPVPEVTPSTAGLGIQCAGADSRTAFLSTWWKMDEGSGTKLIDSSSATETGVSSARWTAGRVGHALSFDGVQSYVTLAPASRSALDFGEHDFSIEGWIKGSSSSGASGILDHRSSGPYRGFHLYLYRGALGLQLADGTGKEYTNWNSYHAGKPAIIADGERWHHFAVTVNRANADGLKFYVDGARIEPATFDPRGRRGSLSNPGRATIGRWAVQPTGFFRGSLDELTTYLGVLGDDDIKRIYEASALGKCR